MTIRKPYDTHERVQIQFPNPSLTKQAMKEDTDINNIMKKYAKTGIMTHLAKHQGSYGDFTGVRDYHTALNKMIEADKSFASLPSGVRSKFNNDAGKFMDFVHDPANAEEMVEMGLAHAPEPEPAPLGPDGLRVDPPASPAPLEVPEGPPQ